MSTRYAYKDESLLVQGVVRVRHQHRQRIPEYGGRLIEGDTVLSVVRFRLRGAPLKYIAHELKAQFSHKTRTQQRLPGNQRGELGRKFKRPEK